MAKYDDMSFGKAFAAARSELGSGKTFTYKGKSYSTNTADGKKAAPKSAAPAKAAGGVGSSPRPMPRPQKSAAAAGGVGSSPRPQPRPAKAAAAVATSNLRQAAGTPTAGYDPKPRVGAPLNPNLRTQAGRAAAVGQSSGPRTTPTPAAQPAPAPRAKGIFQKIGDFFDGGGYAGMKARERAAAARDRSDQKRK